ncbi:MAG: hypothetical protein J5I41_12645 [Saprospiraceae bacterium]|nr:hypothetical protein [Saprospiraceae bacterium]
MKKWFIGIALLALAGLAIGLYMYFKPLPGMEDLRADHKVAAASLYEAFDQDEAGASSTYLGKVVEVEGTIQSVEAGDHGGMTVILEAGGLMGGVLCRMDPGQKEATEALQPGAAVRIRGECVGKLMDVELSRCVIL